MQKRKKPNRGLRNLYFCDLSFNGSRLSKEDYENSIFAFWSDGEVDQQRYASLKAEVAGKYPQINPDLLLFFDDQKSKECLKKSFGQLTPIDLASK